MSENTNQEPTAEEIKAYKNNMLKFYEEQMPFLESQKRYETLKADIEEAKYRQLENRLKFIQLQLSVQEKPEEDGNSESDQ
jgi:hypothetical protein